MNHNRKNRSAQLRGTALAETIMVIPMLGFVLALTFFFGWAMRNQQGVRQAAHYSAWRRVLRNEGSSSSDLNRKFLFDAASPVETSGSRAGKPTLEDYADFARGFSKPAGQMVQETAVENYPRGHSSRVAAEFPSDVGLWRAFSGAIRARHTREGVEWRRGEASVERAVRELHMTGIEQTLDNIPPPGNVLADRIRDLYRSPW